MIIFTASVYLSLNVSLQDCNVKPLLCVVLRFTGPLTVSVTVSSSTPSLEPTEIGGITSLSYITPAVNSKNWAKIAKMLKIINCSIFILFLYLSFLTSLSSGQDEHFSQDFFFLTHNCKRNGSHSVLTLKYLFCSVVGFKAWRIYTAGALWWQASSVFFPCQHSVDGMLFKICYMSFAPISRSPLALLSRIFQASWCQILTHVETLTV